MLGILVNYMLVFMYMDVDPSGHFLSLNSVLEKHAYFFATWLSIILTDSANPSVQHFRIAVSPQTNYSTMHL